ncbi:MAG TPA: hypothetical protein VLC10_03435, partial [Patescibacteria group bacterium]|nr:hypothetical protein [Patescibacteria group bacterium]
TARGTTGMTGADLENLLNEAALYAAKLGKDKVSMADIEYARDKIFMGPERKGNVLSKAEKNVVAHHESGHALVGWLTPDADPVHRVTIVPRGKALGLTWSLPTQDVKLYRKNQLLAQIDVLYGGRMAEELVLGEDITTGARNDYERLTAIARAMITDYAMGPEDLGLRTFGDKERGFVFEHSEEDYGATTASRIDTAVDALLKARRARVRELIQEHKDKLIALAAMLLEQETVESVELEKLFGPRPAA